MRLWGTREHTRLADLLVAQAALVETATEHLAEAMLTDQAVRDAVAEQVRELDHRAEGAALAVLRAMSDAFVVPFDRADVHRLAWGLRRCVARVDAAADGIALFAVGELPALAPDLVQLLARAAHVTVEACGRLGRPADLVDPWLELIRIVKQGHSMQRRMLQEITAPTAALADTPEAGPATARLARLTRLVAIADALDDVVGAFDEVADALQTVAVRES